MTNSFNPQQPMQGTPVQQGQQPAGYQQGAPLPYGGSPYQREQPPYDSGYPGSTGAALDPKQAKKAAKAAAKEAKRAQKEAKKAAAGVTGGAGGSGFNGDGQNFLPAIIGAAAIIIVAAIAAFLIATGSIPSPFSQNNAEPEAAQTEQDASAGAYVVLPNGDKATQYNVTENADGSRTYSYIDLSGASRTYIEPAAAEGTAAGQADDPADAMPSSGDSDSSPAALPTEEDDDEYVSTITPVCDHNWVIEYKRVNHPAVYKTTGSPAVTKTVTETASETVCNSCGAIITGKADAHIASTGHAAYTKNVPVKSSKTVVVKKATEKKKLVKKAYTERKPTGKLKCTLCGEKMDA